MEELSMDHPFLQQPKRRHAKHNCVATAQQPLQVSVLQDYGIYGIMAKL